MHTQFDQVQSSRDEAREKGETEAARVRLVQQLSILTVDVLQGIYRAVTGEVRCPAPKIRLVEALASSLLITNEAEHEAFMSRFTPGIRSLIELAVFESWIPVETFEVHAGPAFVEQSYQYYGFRKELRPEAHLDLFRCSQTDDHFALHPWLRELLAPFAPKPAGWEPKVFASISSESWSVADSIQDILPLFRNRTKEFLAGREVLDIVRKGFRKSECVDLRKSSGLPAFRNAGEAGLDSGELLARFLVLFDRDGTPEDPLDAIKLFVERFLSGFPPVDPPDVADYAKRSEYELGMFATSVYEQMALLDHLSRRESGLMQVAARIPPARREFAFVLKNLEALGKGSQCVWLDADELFTALDQRRFGFAVVDALEERRALGLKADKYLADESSSNRETYESMRDVSEALRRDCLARPVFEQYVYLFAALGILEIAEREPACPVIRKGKAVPVSPADCLGFFRLTELGRWCLGYSSLRPAVDKSGFVALADEELLIVTFRGSSLERRLYLDAVAVPLGPERWRFSEARFIEGCDSFSRILSRIDDFRRLISATPSRRWETFFDGILTRAEIIQDVTQVLRLRIPQDPAIRRIFLENSKIRALVLRVEDGSVIFDADRLGELSKLLAAEGFWAPDLRRLRKSLAVGEP